MSPNTPPPVNPAPDDTTGPGPTPPPGDANPAFNPQDVSKDARTMGMLAHLLGVFLGFIGPLIIWLIKKDEMPFVEDQGKEALNWEITMLLASLVIGIPTCGFGVFGVVILDIVFNIIGAMKANEGVAYRYPFALRLIK